MAQKKQYIKASKGRDYDYDRARGSYSGVRRLQAQQNPYLDDIRKDASILTKDTDDHGRFSGDGDLAEQSESVIRERVISAYHRTLDRFSQ